MTVTIDPSAGFCWGVVRTIQIAEEELQKSSEMVSLGDIIHNPKEVERLEALGMSTIAPSDLASMPRGSKVLIRAHGEPGSTYRTAAEHGIELVDATCPVVTKLQERIRRYYDDGYQVVIFGKKEHAEVVGLSGVCNGESIVIRTLDEAQTLVDPVKKTVLFSQTTMDKEVFRSIRAYLQKRIEECIVDSAEDVAAAFHAKDTICGQVSGRDKKLRKYASDNDVVIFIAGRKSSNGKVLFNISKDENPNTFFIEELSEIESAWLDGAERIGISGATSTPQWLMEQAKKYIERLSL